MTASIHLSVNNNSTKGLPNEANRDSKKNMPKEVILI